MTPIASRFAAFIVALLVAAPVAAQTAPQHPTDTEATVVLQAAPAATVLSQPSVPRRPVVSVIDFDTERTAWAPPPQLGATLADVLADRLVQSGQYRVLDREFLGAPPEDGRRPPLDILRECATRAGVQYLVVGSVTMFSIENKQKSAGGILGGIGAGLLHLPFVGGLNSKSAKSAIALTIRVIDVKTGEIAATATGQGTSSRTNLSLGGLSAITKVVGAGGYSSTTTGSHAAQLDEALQQAITAVGQEIIMAAPRLVLEMTDGGGNSGSNR
jgi:curli biogenesis system outer membrane secretion channel CsgG